MDPADSLLPLTIRVNALESRVFGTSSYGDAPRGTSTRDMEGKRGESSRTAARRLREMNEALDRVGESSVSLKRLIDNYDSYLPYLLSPDSTVPQNTAVAGGAAAPTTALREAEIDVVPDKVKVTMLLEAAGDIRAAEKDLREVEVLKARNVEGAGSLERLVPLKGNLVGAMERSAARSEELGRARKQVGALLMRYSEYTNTVSDLFIDVHHRLEWMEERVAKMERARRKEMTERY